MKKNEGGKEVGVMGEKNNGKRGKVKRRGRKGGRDEGKKEGKRGKYS